ncbi:MAG TPA: hypothetical protein VFE47_05930 [Tepidisphaeraceae bacterium]|jgi:hypothetical protein|nr:hypothetical protein [Tepidisphaeraceae bacterium]
MASSNLRSARRPVFAEALESRTLLSATPILLEQVISTGKHATYHESTLNGIPFGVNVRNGTVDVYKVDNRIEVSITGTDDTSTIIIGGHVQFADVAVYGPMKSFSAPTITLAGTMAVAGSLDKLNLGGVSGTLAIRGDLGTGNIGGVNGMVAVGGAITKLTTGALNNATILSGAIVPADSPIGATNNTYAPGAIGTLNINGEVINSNIAVGVSPGPDNIFGTADDTSAGGGEIGKITVSQGADPTSHFEAGAFGTVKIRAFGTIAPIKKLTNPLSDSHFLIPGQAPQT